MQAHGLIWYALNLGYIESRLNRSSPIVLEINILLIYCKDRLEPSRISHVLSITTMTKPSNNTSTETLFDL